MAETEYDSTNAGTYLASLNGDGKAPARRIKDAVQAELIYWQCFNRYNYGRGKINAKIQGALNGNPPIDQAKLEAEGLGWMSNVNFRLLEADVNAAMVPYYMLFADAPTYTSWEVDDPNYSDKQNRIFANIMSEEHKKVMDDWKYFDYYMQMCIANRTIYGVGNVYFINKFDPRFRVARQGSVFVPDETTQDMNDLSLLFIYDELDLVNLYLTITNNGAEDAGWNVKHVKQILTNICNEHSGFTRYRSWEYWEQKFREGDVYWSQITPKVRVAYGYTKEFTGNISAFIILANQTGSQGEFLYYCQDEYEKWDEVIHPFFYEIGNGNWNGVKGLGTKAYNFRDAQNRLKNRLLDAAAIGSQVLIQTPDERSAANLELQQLGPFAIIPNSAVQFQQMPLMSTLDKPLAIDNAMEATLQSNIGGNRQNITDQKGQPVSAAEAQINASYSTQITQASQTVYLRQLDDLYTEQSRRLCQNVRSGTKDYPLEDWEEMIKSFQEGCTRRGVPKTTFKHVRRVLARRTIGRGSEYAKQQQSTQVYGILRNDPNVPQSVVIQHLRNMVSNFTGTEYLQQIWPEQTVAPPETEDASKAQDENAALTLGIPPIWTEEQNNYAHFVTHIRFIMPQVQAIQQANQQAGLVPSDQKEAYDQQMSAQRQQFLKMAQPALQHIQQHLGALRSTMPGQAFQQAFNQVEQLQATCNLIAQNEQQYQVAQQNKQIAAQQKQQKALSDESIKAHKTMHDEALNRAKTIAEINRKDALARADIQTKHRKTRADIGAKRGAAMVNAATRMMQSMPTIPKGSGTLTNGSEPQQQDSYGTP